MQDPDAVDISELMHLETIGELIDFIAMAQDELSELPEVEKSPANAHISLPPSAWLGREHPVTLAQQNILVSQFLSREKNGEWNIAVARWLEGAIEKAHQEHFWTCCGTHRSSNQIPPQRATPLPKRF